LIGKQGLIANSRVENASGVQRQCFNANGRVVLAAGIEHQSGTANGDVEAPELLVAKAPVPIAVL
jgi:hypothetical protein